MLHHINYPCTHMEQLSSIKLTDSPLDDYQRYYFSQIQSGLNSSVSEYELLKQTSKNLNIRSTSYKTNSALLFCNLSSGHKADISELSLKERRTLDCFEYLIPDITKDTNDSASNLDNSPKVVDLNQAWMQQMGQFSSQISFLTKNQQFKLKKLQYSIESGSAINPNNVILWDHKTGYVFFTGIWRIYQDVMRAMCNMKRGNTLEDEEECKKRQIECIKELDYSLKNRLYKPYSEQMVCNEGASGNKRRLSGFTSSNFTMFNKNGDKKTELPVISSSNKNISNLMGSGTSSNSGLSLNYVDVHWNQIDPAWKEQLCKWFQASKNLSKTPDFEDCCRRIRGGYIKIQGTWLPFEISRTLCVRFCFPIRYLLVPIFGISFPKDCEDWYLGLGQKNEVCHQNQTIHKRSSSTLDPLSVSEFKSFGNGTQTRKKWSTSSRAEPSGTDSDLIDASQNLLQISRGSSTSEHYPTLLFPSYHNHLESNQYNFRPSFVSFEPGSSYHDSKIFNRPGLSHKKYHSWSGTSNLENKKHHRQSLPPISTLIDSLPNFTPANDSYIYAKQDSASHALVPDDPYCQNHVPKSYRIYKPVQHLQYLKPMEKGFTTHLQPQNTIHAQNYNYNITPCASVSKDPASTIVHPTKNPKWLNIHALGINPLYYRGFKNN